ncbi:MAG: carboxypeptidase regulatory-like domain-containing protein [Myxococcales bacterium]|nr:carboxypeptidase regulatory-like domain-containing protein [Myxococcales bacterium]
MIVLGMNVAMASTSQVRIHTPGATDLAQDLARQGFDVVEGSEQGDTVDLVVGASEREQLDRMGLDLRDVRQGRPLVQRPLGYPSGDAIERRLRGVAEAHPHVVRLVDLTQAYGPSATEEGRPLWAVVISDRVEQDEGEPAVQLLGGLHAREVVTPLVVLHAVDQLVQGYGRDPEITRLVDDHELWAAPVFNPDGYAYVFEHDDLWRKNRRVFDEGVGVDLNRNYDFEWRGGCPGSGRVTASTYRGPQAESERETQVQVAWSADRRFAKVLEFHSFGEKVLWGYSCSPHPFDTFLQEEASRLAVAFGWEQDATRPPSAEGEHYEWQLAAGAHAMLVETASQFQPPAHEAQEVAESLWPGILAFLLRPISVHGTVTDAITGGPVVARAELPKALFLRGEAQHTTGPWGRFHHTLPPGEHRLRFSAPGYVEIEHEVEVSLGSQTVLDVVLHPDTRGLSCAVSPLGTAIPTGAIGGMLGLLVGRRRRRG